jgi:hypothetical protein
MPTQFQCDGCGATAASLVGWRIVVIQYIHDDGTSTSPPYSRTCDVILPDLFFHSTECAVTWANGAKVAPPPSLT